MKFHFIVVLWGVFSTTAYSQEIVLPELIYELKRPETTADFFGTHLAGVGDLNGDGYGDFAVASPIALPEGQVLIYSGADHSVIHSIPGHYSGAGSTPSGRFGDSIIKVGNFDGLGNPDFAISDPNAYDKKGFVAVYCGDTGAQIFFQTGENTGDRFGESLAAPGNIDPIDFRDDILIGAPGYGGGQGKIYAYQVSSTLSGPGNLIYSIPNVVIGSRHLGASLAILSDLDGDETKDFVAGAPSRVPPPSLIPEYIQRYSGKTGLPIGTPIAPPITAPHGDFGASLATGGDVFNSNNQQGNDILVGAPTTLSQGGLPGAGAVHIYDESTGVYMSSSRSLVQDTLYGFSISIIGNLPFSGQYDEYIVGVPSTLNANRVGAFEVHSHDGGFDQTLLAQGGQSAKDRLGISVQSLGDINQDGLVDFGVGASQGDPFSSPYVKISRKGYVKVFSTGALSPRTFASIGPIYPNKPTLSLAGSLSQDTAEITVAGPPGSAGVIYVCTPLTVPISYTLTPEAPGPESALHFLFYGNPEECFFQFPYQIDWTGVDVITTPHPDFPSFVGDEVIVSTVQMGTAGPETGNQYRYQFGY